MILKRLKGTLIERGFVLTLVLSVSCLFLFFGKLVGSANHLYFGEGGDGLQAYFGALYHIKYDDSYWQMKGMNYPYGDQVFFTGCQPFVANTLKLINHVVNVYDYTVGILNLIMLVSIVLSALCLYLLFKHLRIPYYYSAIAATAIAFLSPQLDRLGGHYSLTYQFAIPLFLLLLLKFYEQPTMKKSIWIGIFVFFITGTHFYFFGLFAITAVVYWSALYFSKEREFGKFKFAAKHFFIQLALPFLLVQLIMVLIDDVNDRTGFPYGYLEYTSNLAGVFFPPGRFYSPLFEKITLPKFPEWEGVAYVGIIGVITFIAFLIVPIKRLFSKQYKQLFKVTDNTVLSIFFWASIPALLLAFGYPFKIKGLEWLLFYSGPLKQLRGIGRFTWILFYVINILAIYTIANLSIKKFPALKHILMITALFFIGYDAYIMANGRQDHLNNRIPVLEDKSNQLPEDQWLNQINTSDFQALITLPYTHIGSENIWVFSESQIMRDGFLVSLKTGLPMLSLISSRTSLSQTYKNIQIIKEPYRRLEILDEFKNKKPILVIAKENELNQTEKDFLMHCQLLKHTLNYTIYSLQFDALLHISDTLYHTAKARFNNSRTYAIDEFLSTDSVKTFVYDGFEKKENIKAFSGKGCFEGSLKTYNIIYKGGIPNWKDQEYTLSFWMDDFTKDRYPRSTIELVFLDPAGNIYKTEYASPGQIFTVLDHQWALLEKTIKLNGKDDQVLITIWSELMRDEKEKLRVDELFIRPSSTFIYKMNKGVITINNKTYFGNDI
jgi:hypothetical protein